MYEWLGWGTWLLPLELPQKMRERKNSNPQKTRLGPLQAHCIKHTDWKMSLVEEKMLVFETYHLAHHLLEIKKIPEP